MLYLVTRRDQALYGLIHQFVLALTGLTHKRLEFLAILFFFFFACRFWLSCIYVC